VHNIWLKHYEIIQWEIITPSSSSSSFIHHYTLFHFIQTLTTLHLEFNQIGDKGAQYLAEALQHNSVSDHHSFSFFFFVYSIISRAFISYRHSPHSTFNTIKSELKVHNIWLKHYNTIQWVIIIPSSSSSSFIHRCTLFLFIQTLTTLDLGRNKIGAQGAQHLSEALRNNSVRDHHSFSFFFFVYSISSHAFISYRHSLHSTLARIKSEIKVQNIWVKHYSTIQWVIIIPSSSSSSFIHHCTLFLFIQTLTTLDLSFNKIGDQGGKYLAEVKKKNINLELYGWFLW